MYVLSISFEKQSVYECQPPLRSIRHSVTNYQLELCKLPKHSDINQYDYDPYIR